MPSLIRALECGVFISGLCHPTLCHPRSCRERRIESQRRESERMAPEKEEEARRTSTTTRRMWGFEPKAAGLAAAAAGVARAATKAMALRSPMACVCCATLWQRAPFADVDTC